MATPVNDLFKVALHGKSSKRFLLACLLSFSFSIAVILGTIGIMDGFEDTLKKSLHKANGHVSLISRSGFFFFDSKLKKNISIEKTKEVTALIQTQGFVIKDEASKGVVIKGVNPKRFAAVTNLEIENVTNGIAIGKVLAKKLSLKVGDRVVVALAKGNDNVRSLPKLVPFEVEAIVSHGIYEKDLRYIYVKKENLGEVLNLVNRSNVLYMSLKDSHKDYVNSAVSEIRDNVGEKFKVKAYWAEFYGLLKAVEIEKFTITLILQIIVLIAVFNIAAFVIYISEKKSQDLFLIQAIGASSKSIKNFWYILIFFLWVASCILSIVFINIFNYLLGSLDVFKIPGEIYVLSQLKINLGLNDFLLVFVITLVWMFLVAFFSIRKISKKTILSGLRQEFS